MAEDVQDNSQILIEKRKNLVPNGLNMLQSSTAAQAKKGIIVDASGKESIDFTAGLGALNTGHCPKPVVEAIQEQASKLIHSPFSVATHELYINLVEKLIDLFPHGENTKALLTNTGAEAVENAVKIARQYTKRRAVLCFTGAVHGRTNLTLSLTSKITYKKGCGPFSPEIYRIAFPNYHRYGDGLTREQFADREIAKLREALLNVVNEENLAAIVIELVQCEGGVNIAPKPYIQELRRLCNEKGIVLIFDEIQTGFGRTGRMGAYQNFDVVPDISAWSKSLAAGMPIGAVIGKSEIMDAAAPGTVGDTFAGNPVVCAAAIANLEYMEKLKISQLAKHVEIRIHEKIKPLHKLSFIGDIRGMGAMIAIEFNEDKNPRKPLADVVSKIIKSCSERGILLQKAGTYNNIIRLLPPIVISDLALDKGLNVLLEEIDIQYQEHKNTKK